MSWQTKFLHEFRDSNDVLRRVYILEDGTPSPVEVDGEPSPFKIIYPEIKDKLEPVRGSGCELNLISATDRQLLDLFTADIKQYRIVYTTLDPFSIMKPGLGYHDSTVEKWVASNSNTLVWDSDGGVGAAKCTYVDGPAGMSQYLRDVDGSTPDLRVSESYKLSVKVRAASGTFKLAVYDGTTMHYSADITNSTYEWVTISFDATHATNCYVSFAEFSSGDILYVDEWKLEHLHTIHWAGYLDSEQYSEDYSSLTDYPVQFTGNNGLGILDRIKFLDSGSPYTGLKTQWEVIEIILTKWGLLDLVTAIKVYLSTTSDYITPAAEETIIHDTYTSCANYYDEDGEPMSCREVLEAILAPYGAFLTILGTEILITDLHTLATDAGFTWKCYDNTLTYDTTEASETIPDIETIGYYEGGAKLDMVAGRNTQVVKYSPYALDELDSKIQWNKLLGGAGSNMTFSSGTEPHFVPVTSWDTTYYTTDNITGLDGWTFTGTGGLTISGMKDEIDSSPEYLIRKDCDAAYDFDDDHSEVTFDIPHVIGMTGYYIKITGKVLALTRHDKYHEGSFVDNANFNHIAVLARLRIGDFLYSAGTYSWIAYPGTITTDHQFMIFGGNEDGNCTNTWHSFKTLHWALTNSLKHPVTEDAIYIYVDEGIHGKVSLELTLKNHAYVGAAANGTQTSYLREVWLKDIKIEVVDNPSFESVSGDIEYTGKIIEAWKDEGKKVTLYHGNSNAGSPFDNAGLIYDSGAGVYKFIPDWSRGSLTDVTIEKLLLNTIQSNYETKTTELSVKINNTGHKPFLRIEDDTYLSGKLLMFAGGTIDCINNSMECSLVEIRPDTLT